ncbi:MAG: UTP--glucose-1-phosphate uridylyltransferase [Planctomycetes bacterium]|nr:UTP--glucose-1-phosphate uridylyltransferase [Planctomycetota bacterium]
MKRKDDLDKTIRIPYSEPKKERKASREAERAMQLAKDSGHDHLFRFWKELGDDERAELVRDVESIDFGLLGKLADKSSEDAGERKFGAIDAVPLPRSQEETLRHDEIERLGSGIISKGLACAFLVAGGQGSRLGFEGPKGCFPLGPKTGMTLYEIFAIKLDGLCNSLGVSVPWYILTSVHTHDETVNCFVDNDFFGFPRSDVWFFPQDEIPAIDATAIDGGRRHPGKAFLQTRSRVFKNPNGHGGSLLALSKSGALADMKKRGIEEIFYFQVDNPLVRMCDPYLLGLHCIEGSEMSNKAVMKTDPNERVGILGLINNEPGVIEYSELSDEQNNRRDPNGDLVFRAGNAAIHYINRDFVERITSGGLSLPYHRARKSCPSVDDSGSPVTVTATKFEMFVFDALKLARRTLTHEISRELEFAPVKNSEGADSPETSSAAMRHLAKERLLPDKLIAEFL